MEPQMIDYYNDMPYGVNVIDKRNEELAELQLKYDELLSNHKKLQTKNNKSIKKFEEFKNKMVEVQTTINDILY